MPRARSLPHGHTFELGRFDVLGSPRRVRVHVPPPPSAREGARARGDEKRPALLLFDGQNMLDDHGSFAGGWHAHAAVDKHASVRDGHRAPVLVALDHGGASRIDELAPFSHGAHGGKLDRVLDVLVDRVLPALHARLPIVAGPEGHTIGGSSMGGLAALYAHFRRPDVFAGALAMSPSLWFASRRVVEFVLAQSNPYRSRVYLDAGAREAKGRMLALAADLATHLRARGYREETPPRGALGTYLMWRPDQRGGHDERSWRRRLPKALRFLFP